MLIHLQIAEALERTIGQDYRRKLFDYEKSKTDEIYDYIKNKCSTKCIKHMNEKLMTYMKFMKDHNKGCVSLTYGEDVYSGMPNEECEFMNVSYEMGLAIKEKMVLNQEHAYREAYDAITQDIDLVSDAVIKHKIKRLQPF